MLRNTIVALIAATIAFGSHIARAADCSDQFFQGKPPIVAATGQGWQVCHDTYAVFFSADTKTPLWSADHLDQARIAETKTGKRPKVKFKRDPAVPASAQADNDDFPSDRFDRGHMSPDGDMPDLNSRIGSFLMTNVVPQQACDNEGVWETIEVAVRAYAGREGGDVYVVTGPVFDSSPPERVGPDQVAVPTRIFKAIYDAQSNQAGAYLSPNDDSGQYSTVSVAELTQITGVDPFPAAPDDAKSAAMVLPTPGRPDFACRLHAK